MLLKIRALSCCAARYVDAHSSRAQSESGKRGTRGRGFHKGAEKSGAQSNVSVVKKERDHESAEKENRSRPGGGCRGHRKESGASSGRDVQRHAAGRAADGH